MDVEKNLIEIYYPTLALTSSIWKTGLYWKQEYTRVKLTATWKWIGINLKTNSDTSLFKNKYSSVFIMLKVKSSLNTSIEFGNISLWQLKI